MDEIMNITSNLFEAYLKCPTNVFFGHVVKREPEMNTQIGCGLNPSFTATIGSKT